MFRRTLKVHIENALTFYPVIIVTGPRQVGKSTMVYSFTKTHQFNYVTLDDLNELQLAKNDPIFFISRFEGPLIIDEIQYAPQLLEVIESIVNKKRLNGDANGSFILTGSQTFQLMQNVTQSLAGRATIFKMFPLSSSEINQTSDFPFVPDVLNKTIKHTYTLSSLFKQISRGGYPELYKQPNLPTTQFYRDYVATYLDRDVSTLVGVKNKLLFHNFMQLLASLTGSQINVSNLAKQIGVSSPTIKEWLSILESSGIIYLLQPYNDHSMTKRLVKSPKLYFTDTGLAAYLAKFYDADNLSINHFSGAFMETHAIIEIMKSFLNNNLPFDAYYYRDSNQNEVDLVLIVDGTLHLIEIKKGAHYNLSDVKSFKQLEGAIYPLGTHCIISNTETCYALNRSIFVYPIGVI